MEKQSSVDKAKQCFTAAREAEESGNFASAVDLMEKALQLRPDFAPYWVSLGRLLRTWSKFQDSEAATRKAIEIEPTACYAWSELGLLFQYRRLFEKAAECYRRSIQMRPDFNTYTLLAHVEIAFDVEQALLDAEKALELNPDFDEAIQIRDGAKRIIKQRKDKSKKRCRGVPE